MSTGMIVAIVSVVVVAVATVAFLLHTRRHHPEQTAGHQAADQPMEPTVPEGISKRATADRPAGPGAEGMSVPEPGAITPGPPPRR
ncbi:MAG: hypothetical protein AB7O92_33365 [Acidimicrobiia bacterium]